LPFFQQEIRLTSATQESKAGNAKIEKKIDFFPEKSLAKAVVLLDKTRSLCRE
jgi:hypothetical protein